MERPEYVDRGVSGSKDRGPALEQRPADAKRRRVDVLVVWRFWTLWGPTWRHLILLLDELAAVGVASYRSTRHRHRDTGWSASYRAG